MQGARASQEVFNVSWKLALRLERAKILEIPFSGVSLDRRKFFDLLVRNVGDGLLEHMGMPKQQLVVEKALYVQSRARLKIGNVVSNTWSRERGYYQGRCYSIEAALAAMTVWTRVLESKQAVVSSFLDDGNVYAEGSDHHEVLANSWKTSNLFDKYAGAETNVKKTKFYASDIKQRMKTVDAIARKCGVDKAGGTEVGKKLCSDGKRNLSEWRPTFGQKERT